MEKDTIGRSLHDVGLASWFGGSLMGAVGVDPAAAAVGDRTGRSGVARAGWSRWAPVNAAAIGAHVLGAAELSWANRARIRGQRGVAAAAAAKALLTAAALGATAYSRALGSRIDEAGEVPVESGAVPARETPAAVAAAQRRLRVVQWAVPALTGGMVLLNALMGEQ